VSLFKKLLWEPSDKKLLNKIRSLKGSDWSTASVEIVEFRKRLLTLQNWRCVYCQSPIERDETGYRELDHILPKAATKNCTHTKAKSNNEKDRRHTFGYSGFTFEPRNLAAACKRCNNFKGSFDPLVDRTKTPIRYPKEPHFLWVHAHEHFYEEHIKLDCDTWTYTHLTEQGDYVIRTCKLNKIAVIESACKTRAIAKIAHSGNFIGAFRSVTSAVSSKTMSIKHAANALNQQFGADIAEMRNLMKLHINVEKRGDLDDMAAAAKELAMVNIRIKSLAKSAKKKS